MECRALGTQPGEQGGTGPWGVRRRWNYRRRILAAAAPYLRAQSRTQLVMMSSGAQDTDQGRKDWRYWCAYLVMIAPNAAVGLTLAAMPPILPELATRLGGEHNAQLIVSVAGFGIIVGGLFSGRLLEWAGVRAFTLLSLVIYGVFGVAGWFLTSALTMGASRFLLGIGGVFFSTAALA